MNTRLLIIFSLGFCLRLAAGPRAPADLSKIADVVQVIASITNRHPNFVSQNTAYRRNLFELYNEAGQVVRRLEENASPTDFGGTDFLSAKYSSKPIVFDEAKLRLLRQGLLRDLDNLDIKKLGTVSEAIEQLKEISKREGKFDHKVFKKRLGAFLRLVPVLYDNELNPLHADFETHKRELVNKLSILDVGDIDNLYNDTFRLHQEPELAKLSQTKGLGVVNEGVNTLRNQFLTKQVHPALLPVASGDEGTQSLRGISIERVPPLAGIVRGCFGGDCSMTTVPHYPLVKGTWVYWIRKSENLEGNPDGYALVTTIEHQGKKIPYIITTNGSGLGETDIRAVKHLVAKDFKSPVVFTHNFEAGTRNIVNTDAMRRGLKPEGKSKQVTVEMPPGWKEVDRLSSEYYKADTLRHAVLENVAESPMYFEDLKVTHLETPYPRPKKIEDMSRFERALIAAQANSQRSAHVDAGEVLKALSVTPEDLQTAQSFLSSTHQSPIGAKLYKKLLSDFELDHDLLTKTDYLTAIASLAKIEGEVPGTIPPKQTQKMAEDFATTLNHELGGLMREAPNLRRNEVQLGFDSLVQGLETLSRFPSDKMDQQRLKFVDQLFSDAAGDKALDAIGREKIISAIGRLLPHDPGYIADKALDALGSTHKEQRELGKAVLLSARQLDSEIQGKLLDRLFDPDAEKTTKEIFEHLDSIDLKSHTLLPELVNDPDVGSFVVKEILPKLSRQVSPSVAKQIHEVILQRNGELLDVLRLGVPDYLGPVDPKIRGKILEKLDSAKNYNDVHKLLCLDESCLFDAKPETRQELLKALTKDLAENLSERESFLRRIRTKLSPKEYNTVVERLLSTLQSEISQGQPSQHTHYNEKDRLEAQAEWRERVQRLEGLIGEFAQDRRRAASLASKLVLKQNSNLHLPFVLGKLGHPFGWDTWKKRYEKQRAEWEGDGSMFHWMKKKVTELWNANHDSARRKAASEMKQLWHLAFNMAEPMPKDVEEMFWKHVEKGEWINGHFKELTNYGVNSNLKSHVVSPTPLSDAFYEKLLKLVDREKGISAETALSFFSKHPSLKHLPQFAELIPQEIKTGHNWDDHLKRLLAHDKLSPEHKELVLEKVAEGGKLRESSGVVQFIREHSPESCGEGIRCSLLEAYEKGGSHVRSSTAEFFAALGLDITQELANYKDYSALELAQKWFGESFEEDSKWLEMAYRKGLMDYDLINALREDTEGHLDLVKNRIGNQMSLERVFDGLVVKNQSVIVGLIPSGSDQLLAEEFLRFIEANRPTMNAETYNAVVSRLLRQQEHELTRGEPSQHTHYNQKDRLEAQAQWRDRVQRLEGLIGEFAQDRRRAASLASKLVHNQNRNLNLPFVLGKLGHPFGWDTWKKRYEKQVADGKSRTDNVRWQAASGMKELWHLAFNMAEPMPKDVEEMFWKHVDDGGWIGGRIKELTDYGVKSNLKSHAVSPTPLSDAFYEKLLKLVAREKGISAETALNFFSKHPSLKYLPQFAEFIPGEVESGRRWDDLKRLLSDETLSPEHKELVLEKVAEGGKLRDSSGVVDFIRQHSPESCGEGIRCKLLEAYEKGSIYTREKTAEFFSTLGLDITHELANHKDYTALELAQKWFGENLKEDSKWLEMAHRKGLRDYDLIDALREDTDGHLNLVKNQLNQTPLQRVFDGLVVRDQKVIVGLIPESGTEQPLAEELLRFLEANRATMNAETYNTVVRRLLRQQEHELTRGEPSRHTHYNEKDRLQAQAEWRERVQRLEGLIGEFAQDRRRAASLASKLVHNQNRNLNLPFLLEKLGHPFSWDTWKKRYEKRRAEGKSRNEDLRWKAANWMKELWHLAFNMAEPMPKDVEEMFWKHVEDGEWIDRRFKEFADYGVNSNLKSHAVSPTPLSDAFYEKLLKLVAKEKGISVETALNFFSKNPSLKHLPQVAALIPGAIEAGHSWADLLKRLLADEKLSPEHKELILEKVAEGGKLRESSGVVEFIEEHVKGTPSDPIRAHLVDLYSTGGKYTRQKVKTFFLSRGLNDHASAVRTKNGDCDSMAQLSDE